jgi:hypothetical protein
MKRIVLLFSACIAFAGAALSQATFQMIPPTVSTSVHDTIVDAEGHNIIKNLTNTTKTIRWTRTVICNDPDTTKSQICDPNLCYLPQVSTKTFTLEGNTQKPMVVHFLKSYGVPGSAIIALKFEVVGTPSDSTTAFYLFNNCAAATNTQDVMPQASVKVFPNPTTDVFTLVNDEQVDQIRVYNMNGQTVASFQAIPGSVYSLRDQPVGTYIVGLYDRLGRVFQATEVIRK